MPNPSEGESKKEFVSRCIKETMNDGKAKDVKQAAAICYSKWERKAEEAKAVIQFPDDEIIF